MNRITKTIVALTASLVGSSVVAQTLSVPNTFQAGTPARAAEVNANFSTIANGVNDNAVQIAALTEQLNTLRDRVDYLEAQLEVLEDNSVLKLDGHLDLDTGDPQKPVALFAGVNVQIVNGLGRTDSVNGLGNIIVGYDEERVGGVFLCSDGRYDNQAECLNNMQSWSTIHKSGSHNIVVGKENNYSQYGGLVTGLANSIINGFSTVTGGLKNVAAGRHASVSGGTDNVASADRSSVSGGLRNTTEGLYTSVTGGRDNLARGDSASVTGGSENKALSLASSVTGGLWNTASGIDSTVSGGHANIAAGRRSTISGGYQVVTTEENGHKP